jgi:hypothetical protein
LTGFHHLFHSASFATLSPMGFALVASSLWSALRQEDLQSFPSWLKLHPQEWHQYFHWRHSFHGSSCAVAPRPPPPPQAVSARLRPLRECSSLFIVFISRSRSVRAVGQRTPEAAVPDIEPDIVPVPSVSTIDGTPEAWKAVSRWS